MILLLVAFSWMGRARLIRSVALQQRNMEYVSASKTMGTRNLVIMFREVVPNLLPVIAPDVVLTIATTIGVETGLSMLGFGLPQSTPSLGSIINNAMVLINLQQRWWMWFPAILLIFTLTLCINFIGQAIQRVADPRQRLV
jgi:peptide/nickel transport system permease protein